MAEQKGLEVKGYRPTQSEANVDRVNRNKVIEELALRAIDEHVEQGTAYDQRCVALARTAIQDGFMWLNRGVFQPKRIDGDLEL